MSQKSALKQTFIEQKNLPLHQACLTGDKIALKNIVSSVPRRHLDIKDSLGRTPLILTVTRNHVECGAVLLKCGVTVDSTDNAGQTALHIAASKGFYQFVRLLLTYKASWMQRDYFGATALHMAAINSNSKGLSAILKYVKPAEIDIPDSTLKTALHWTAAYALNENMKMLLALGANSCIPDVEGKTPLHWVVANSNPEALDCVRTLLKQQEGLIDWQDYQGRSPLHIAVNCGSEDILYFLASVENCNTDILDNSFCTPLHCAAKKGYSEKADILLKKRASHLSVDDNGATPLHYAAHNNHAETVKVFASKSYICDDHPDGHGRNALIWGAVKGAEESVKAFAMFSNVNLSFTDKNKLNALHAAAIYGHVGVIEELVKLGIPVDAKDNFGMTPFLKACEFGRSNAAQALLNLGADMKARDVNGCMALHWCALGGSAYLSQILIRRCGEQVDYNIQDSNGLAPLHYACIAGDFINCTCVLVESGANPNIEDFEGQTPLHAAVLHYRIGIVRYLCEHGADVNAMFLKNDWITPLDCAIMQGDKEIILLLRSHGGVSAADIKELAAVTIQKWYHQKIKVKIQAFKKSSIFPYSYSQPTSFVNSSLYLCSKESKCISLSELPRNFYQNPNYNSLYHVCNGCYHKIVCTHVCKKSLLHPHNPVEHKAAIKIQRAWKKYILKAHFARMRSKVASSFSNQNKRLVAEEKWNQCLNGFYQQLN